MSVLYWSNEHMLQLLAICEENLADWPACRHLHCRHLKLGVINSTPIISEGTLKRPVKPLKILAFIDITPQKQLTGCLNSYKVSFNPNKVLPNLLLL